MWERWVDLAPFPEIFNDIHVTSTEGWTDAVSKYYLVGFILIYIYILKKNNSLKRQVL